MAIGLSRMFNVTLPLNFHSPYKATNIIDFWRRWHMTLSRFLRDYLYVSLGGNRLGRFRRYLNLIVTMLLGGLWHGAGWNFVLWGGLHGVYLVINHGWSKLSGNDAAVRGGIKRFSGWLLTFIAVVIAWVPFRATNFDATLHMLSGMAGMNGVSLPAQLKPLIENIVENTVVFSGLAPMAGLHGEEIFSWLFLGLSIVWLMPNTQQWLSNFSPAWESVTSGSRFTWKPTRGYAVVSGIVFAVGLLCLNRVSEFLYFQF